jgi:hypothetical protein
MLDDDRLAVFSHRTPVGARKMQQVEPAPIIEIRRDWVKDRWVYVGLGAHSPELPFRADAEVQLVVSYLKARSDGRLRVRVDLS